MELCKEKIAEKDKIISNKENLVKKFISRPDIGEFKVSDTEKMGKKKYLSKKYNNIFLKDIDRPEKRKARESDGSPIPVGFYKIRGPVYKRTIYKGKLGGLFYETPSGNPTYVTKRAGKCVQFNL